MKRIESIYFGHAGDSRYTRMAKVLDHSARLHCPEHQVNVIDVRAPITETGRYRMRSFASNSDKLDHWERIVREAPDGDCIALLDADMMIVAPIDSIWATPFDVAITGNRPVRMPNNGGTVFVRVNEWSRAFMAQWLAVNQRMYADTSFHAGWRNRFGGMNQAALGYLIEHDKLAPLTVDCRQWNNCDVKTWPCWKQLGSRIIHLKSGLRRAVFAPGSHSTYRELVNIWRSYERAVGVTLERQSAGMRS